MREPSKQERGEPKGRLGQRPAAAGGISEDNEGRKPYKQSCSEVNPVSPSLLRRNLLQLSHTISFLGSR